MPTYAVFKEPWLDISRQPGIISLSISRVQQKGKDTQAIKIGSFSKATLQWYTTTKEIIEFSKNYNGKNNNKTIIIDVKVNSDEEVTQNKNFIGIIL